MSVRGEHPLLKGVKKKMLGQLLSGECPDPHAILGLHPVDDGWVVRAYHPDALRAELLRADAKPLEMERLGGGLFAARVSGKRRLDDRFRFHFADGSTWERGDPYRFLPTWGDMDVYLAAQGRHLKLYQKMGAHPGEAEGQKGVSFAVWAPNARRVSVIGDFCNWDGRLFPMRRLGASGIWELFIPGLEPGRLYKFEIITPEGLPRVKTDPFAFLMELRPGTAGIIHGLGNYRWGDSEWMEKRQGRDLRRLPMAIYEVHLGSWMRVPEEGNRWLTYRELAPRLAAHCRDHGFNFVEFLPVAEHAFDPSWGYQVTGYYAPTSRYGRPDDLRYLIDYLHRQGIGVIIDWVPAHFPKDDFALRRFDGTACYEYEDARLGEHKDWGTLIFNYGRNEVRNFLLANALYWLDCFHVDGLRIDAVASMLYLDYSRGPGEWLPNRYGGKENLEAIAFLRELNAEVGANFPGAFTVAEESTAFPGVTRPVHLGGLGFWFKWNMGWMNDTLRYMHKDPVYRKYHHNDLTFSMMYEYSENFILPLSHDEVTHGKGSLYQKMPGDHRQRLAQLKALYTYMFTHPGKKLLFMGAEFGQGREWDVDRSLDWHEAGESERAGLQRFVKDLGALYQREKALWAADPDPPGFFWIDCHDADSSVLSYVRWAEGEELVVVLNFTPVLRQGYRIGVPRPGKWLEVLNSDSEIYAGGNVGNFGAVWTKPVPAHGHGQSLRLFLPPFGAVVLKPE